jgi:hypothetical protein
MATTYTVQNPSHAGGQVVYVSPVANGDVVPCGQGFGLLVVNPTANGTITVSMPGSAILSDGLTVSPRVVTIPQAQTWLIPLPPTTHGSTVTLTWTGTLTTVQAACIDVTT